MKQCPSISSNNAIDMEYVSPGKFDVAYFQTLADHRGLHTSDQDYVMNPKTWVYVYDNLKAEQFSANFAQAMVALTNVEVLTGTAGQIRKHCRFVN
jgi:peroxidase